MSQPPSVQPHFGSGVIQIKRRARSGDLLERALVRGPPVVAPVAEDHHGGPAVDGGGQVRGHLLGGGAEVAVLVHVDQPAGEDRLHRLLERAAPRTAGSPRRGRRRTRRCAPSRTGPAARRPGAARSAPGCGSRGSRRTARPAAGAARGAGAAPARTARPRRRGCAAACAETLMRPLRSRRSRPPARAADPPAQAPDRRLQLALVGGRQVEQPAQRPPVLAASSSAPSASCQPALALEQRLEQLGQRAQHVVGLGLQRLDQLLVDAQLAQVLHELGQRRRGQLDRQLLRAALGRDRAGLERPRALDAQLVRDARERVAAARPDCGSARAAGRRPTAAAARVSPWMSLRGPQVLLAQEAAQVDGVGGRRASGRGRRRRGSPSRSSPKRSSVAAAARSWTWACSVAPGRRARAAARSRGRTGARRSRRPRCS